MERKKEAENPKRKRGRPLKNIWLSEPWGEKVMAPFLDKNPCSSRTVRNITYLQNVLHICDLIVNSLPLKNISPGRSRFHTGALTKKAAQFWLDRYKTNPQGVKTLFYEIGKKGSIDDPEPIVIAIFLLHQKVQLKKTTMTELKQYVRETNFSQKFIEGEIDKEVGNIMETLRARFSEVSDFEDYFQRNKGERRARTMDSYPSDFEWFLQRRVMFRIRGFLTSIFGFIDPLALETCKQLAETCQSVIEFANKVQAQRRSRTMQMSCP